jgi:hypothetical protein
MCRYPFQQTDPYLSSVKTKGVRAAQRWISYPSWYPRTRRFYTPIVLKTLSLVGGLLMYNKSVLLGTLYGEKKVTPKGYLPLGPSTRYGDSLLILLI